MIWEAECQCVFYLVLWGEVHPKPKLGMFVLYLKMIKKFWKRNVQPFWSKLNLKSENGIKILVGQEVFWAIDQNTILHVLINNSRTSLPTKFLMSF